MLVLSRKKGERILLPTCGIEVTVLHCGPGRVRIGVSAPMHVKILRGEIAHRTAVEARPRSGSRTRPAVSGRNGDTT
ncbi:MAG: carbon storage regulator [Planctomycetia bacterium]|nr:carbon storage regulator [Planctomycetia bacterium]